MDRASARMTGLHMRPSMDRGGSGSVQVLNLTTPHTAARCLMKRSIVGLLREVGEGGELALIWDGLVAEAGAIEWAGSPFLLSIVYNLLAPSSFSTLFEIHLVSIGWGYKVGEDISR